MKGWISKIKDIQPFFYLRRCNQHHLGFADSKHLGSAFRTNALSSRLAVFHGYSLGIFHLFLCPAFYTIGFHIISSFTRFASRVDNYTGMCQAWNDLNGTGIVTGPVQLESVVSISREK